MASFMFLKLEPTLEGESLVKGHAKEIDVTSWSWGISNPGTAHVAGGGGGANLRVSDLTIQKLVDLASPMLMQKAMSGASFSKATLVCRKGAGDSALEYLTITMEEVMISSFQVSGPSPAYENRAVESISLNFAKVKMKYVGQEASGGEGKKPEHGWNIKEHRAQ